MTAEASPGEVDREDDHDGEQCQYGQRDDPPWPSLGGAARLRGRGGRPFLVHGGSFLAASCGCETQCRIDDVSSTRRLSVCFAAMPRLWKDSVAEHRHAVREAIMTTAATVAARHGPNAVTMSQIAAEAGVGRATLYKYFPDVDAVLVAWHEQQIEAHLQELAAVRDRTGAAGDRLRAVLEAYASIAQEHSGTELAAALHRRDHVARAEARLRDFVRDLVDEGARAGELRSDVPADELASYCLHALGAAGGLGSAAAVRRLVAVTLAGLRAPG